MPCRKTNIFDLFHREVGICRHTSLLWLYIDDNQQWIRGIFLEELVDLQIGGPQFWSRVVPAYALLPRIDLFEHIVHRLDIVVIKEPHRRILLIFFERNYATRSVQLEYPLYL